MSSSASPTPPALPYQRVLDRSRAIRQSRRLLLAAAGLFLLEPLRFFGLNIQVYTAPALSAWRPRMFFVTDISAWRAWTDDPIGTSVGSFISVVCIAALLICVKGLKRRKRRAASFGMYVCLILGALLLLLSLGGGISLAMAVSGYFSGFDFVGFAVLPLVWGFALGVNLILAFFSLRKARREIRDFSGTT